MKVFTGDKIDLEVYAYYEQGSGWGTTNAPLTTLITAIAGAFGGAPSGTPDAVNIYNGVKGALGAFGLGANGGDAAPAAFLNYILFDKNYKVMDMGWQAVPTTAKFAKQRLAIPAINVKEAGYLFTYLSYEDQSNNYVYFDDYTVTYTPTNIVQSNEYYPYGLQTASSWTRENATQNNFLANGGTELNTTSGLYDLDFRNYDPALGRMHQTDPMADKYGSLTTYNYANNNPAYYNDKNGAEYTNTGSPSPSHWSRDMEEISNGNKPSHGTDVLNAYQDSWDVYDHFGMEETTYGFGDLYVNPSLMIDAMDGERNALAWVESAWGVRVQAGVRYRNVTQAEELSMIRSIGLDHYQAYQRAQYAASLTASLKGGWVLTQRKPSITVQYTFGGIENTYQALREYYNSLYKGVPQRIGNNVIDDLINSQEFQTRHERIISGQTTLMNGNFGVDLTFTGTDFFVGHTNIDYSILCNDSSCIVNYNLFVRDGFWDVDALDEKFGKVVPLDRWQADRLGPNLERFGGTPYPFIPVSATSTFPNPGYK